MEYKTSEIVISNKSCYSFYDKNKTKSVHMCNKTNSIGKTIELFLFQKSFALEAIAL